jgi:hypothetical protein
MKEDSNKSTDNTADKDDNLQVAVNSTDASITTVWDGNELHSDIPDDLAGHTFRPMTTEGYKDWAKALNVEMETGNPDPELSEFDEKIYDVIEELEAYHEATSQDKYASADVQLYPSDLFLSDAHGKSINIFNAVKYLSRYLTEGYEKSNNRQDVMKAVHYLLFELVRTK